MFADDNGDAVYGSGESDPRFGAQVTSLPNNITISSLSIGNKADITFLPPDPVTTITGLSATSSQVDIILKDSKTNTIKTIRVNFLGLAEVID